MRSQTLLRIAGMSMVMALIASACGAETSDSTTTTVGVTTAAVVESAAPSAAPGALVSQSGYAYPPAPAVPDGPLAESVAADLNSLWSGLTTGIDTDLIADLGNSGDPRVLWLLSDLLRFQRFGGFLTVTNEAFVNLTGADLADDPDSVLSTWQSLTNHLIAWDLPAPPGYLDWKRIPFEIVEPAWKAFFDDADADIDWRYLSWGGVLIDGRPFASTEGCPRGCIPALDNPAVTDAAEGSWYPDGAIVFGIVVNGEARAYPKNQMEVHEMINDSIGDRRVAIPYCTLCGSAQAYFTDDVPGHEGDLLVFRTSGLLTRSNKVMFELNSFSVFDTFTGEALSGPLQDEAIELDQAAIVTSTWGDWKEAHPDTTIVAEDGGIGRSYRSDPLGGRDDNGPIFPIGAVDGRLGVQDQVLGIVNDAGVPLAFDVEAAREALAAGETVEFMGITVIGDAGGVRALDADGSELGAHQAFWFAWSQFHPDTELWSGN